MDFLSKHYIFIVKYSISIIAVKYQSTDEQCTITLGPVKCFEDTFPCHQVHENVNNNSRKDNRSA